MQTRSVAFCSPGFQAGLLTKSTISLSAAQFAIICGAGRITCACRRLRFAARRIYSPLSRLSRLTGRGLHHCCSSSRGQRCPRRRVAVVGPAGDTVADAVAVRLNDADVTRCVNENAGYVDAAVVCADGGEEKLSTLAERCAGARSIVLVAPAGAADEDEGFSLPNPLKLLDGAAETNDVDEVAERCRNGGARVAVVRHGPLGARASVVAFSQGLRNARWRFWEEAQM